MSPRADTDVNGIGEQVETSIIRAPAILILLFRIAADEQSEVYLHQLQVRGER